MPEYEGSTRTFTAGGTITRFARVALSSGNVVVANAADESIGTALDIAASGEPVAVRLKNAVGTRTMVASGAIAKGDKVFGAASGRISNDASDDYWGIALEAATAAADEIEILPVGGESVVKFIEQDFVIGDFTDNANTTGYVDTTATLPVGALVLGWQAVVATGFTGDTTASLQAGVAANLNQFTTTAPSVLAAATVGSASPGSGDSPLVSTAAAVRLTVTGTADFTSISAGALSFKLAYIEL